MDRHDLLSRYEARGDERDFVDARRTYEHALATRPDPRLLLEYGYLLECHGRNELRRAVELYERAIELDPHYDKPHYQLIAARAALREPERAIADYEQRLAAAPGTREHRFLAQAYLGAHRYADALAVAEAGLELAPGDAALVAARGDAKAGLGDPAGALVDWRRARELDPDDLGPLYSTAFLLEREGRPEEAAGAWRELVEALEARGFVDEAEWPRRELERLRAYDAG